MFASVDTIESVVMVVLVRMLFLLLLSEDAVSLGGEGGPQP